MNCCSNHFFLSFIQAAWHPGSTFDGHLTLLTSDNHIRIFNLDLAQDSSEYGTGVQPEETIALTKSHDERQKRFFGKSALTLRGSLGETAVSFSFAPPVGIDANDPNPNLWPIFILCGDGSVYCMVTGLGLNCPQKSKVMGKDKDKFIRLIINQDDINHLLVASGLYWINYIIVRDFLHICAIVKCFMIFHCS